MSNKIDIKQTQKSSTQSKKKPVNTNEDLLVNKDRKFTPKERIFIDKYIELGNASEAYRQAYTTKGMTNERITSLACALKMKPSIHQEIVSRQREIYKANIATAEEVMDYFTKVMRGEIKDQFGLETPISERTRAAQEIAKRTVDLVNRQSGQADAKIEISLNWNRENE